MTLKSDMLRALNGEVKDVTLVGSDGGRVSATKAVLAIRSPVFSKMFFGNFQEANRDTTEVKMDYSAVVLQVMVKYCYSDELDLDLLHTTEETCMTESKAVAIVQLRDAANYLELSDLHTNISEELGSCILTEDKQALACLCAVLQEVMVRGGTGGPLWATCLDLVQSKPEACLLPDSEFSKLHAQGILACSLELLQELFQSTVLDSFVAVKALQKWQREHAPAQSELQKLADAIRLESISNTNLAEIQPCVLFPLERLHKAFVHHARNSLHSRPAPVPLQMATATVRGAGVECANGVYSWGAFKGCYELEGSYGDMASLFRLLMVEGIWQLVVVTRTFASSDPIVLYKDSSSSTSNSKPPFALWSCVDGKDPTPYVAVQGSVPITMLPSNPFLQRSAPTTTTQSNPFPATPIFNMNGGIFANNADGFRFGGNANVPGHN